MERSDVHPDEAAAASVEPTAPSSAAGTPADPPRALTPVARRRAWTEPRVRLWWVLAAGVLLVTLYVLGTQVAGWWGERRLLTGGVPVQAVIVTASDEVNTISVPNKRMPPDSVCTMEFTLDGRKHEVRGQLRERMERGQPVVTGPDNAVTLRVDPASPEARWTDRTVAPPLLSRLAVGTSVGLPIVALLLLLAALKRRGVLDAWRSGHALPALVLGTTQSPLAPRARAARCTAAEGADKRVFTVYLPPGPAAHAAAGDLVWVVHRGQSPHPAYAAAWFGHVDGAGAGAGSTVAQAAAG